MRARVKIVLAHSVALCRKNGIEETRDLDHLLDTFILSTRFFPFA
jgi:hypothetical protein